MPSAATVVVGGLVIQVVLMIALVGGPMEFGQLIEANYLVAMDPMAQVDTSHMKGASVLITGANRGLGRGIATRLLEAGADVTLACRSGVPGVGEALARETGNAAVDMVRVDMADLASVESAVLALKHKGPVGGKGGGGGESGEGGEGEGQRPPFDHIILNAAVVDPVPKFLAGNGETKPLSRMFAVNYLSNVVLVAGLIREGLVKEGTRVTYIGSGSYKDGSADFFGAYDNYTVLSAMRYYGQTKFLMQTWMQVMHRHYHQAKRVKHGPSLTFGSHNPGPIVSDMGDPASHLPSLLYPTYAAMVKMFFFEPYIAAAPVVGYVTRPDFTPGGYMNVRQVRNERDTRGRGAGTKGRGGEGGWICWVGWWCGVVRWLLHGSLRG